jgi:uncharacterized repeat protein (TIGR02543 family)
MTKFNQEGLRFIIGTLAASVTAILVASILSTSIGTLAGAIRETGGTSLDSGSSNNQSSSEVPEIVNHTVTFNVMGGTALSNQTLVIEDGSFILNFPATSKANHTFDGWYTGVTPNDVLFTSTMPVVQDKTLFARFTLIPENPVVDPTKVTWVVAFDAQGGTPISSVQVEDGRTFQLPTATRTGFNFLGWYTGTLPTDVVFNSTTPVLRNTTLYARWERQSFMLTFISNGGSFVEPMTAQAGSVINAPVNPVRKNYSFTGWFTDVALTALFEFNTMPEISTTLYAGWEAGTFEGLKTSCSTQECIITGYEGIHSELYIPAEIDGVPITMVADRAFQDNTNLVSITFEDGEGATSMLKTIGTSAFSNMSGLRTINLPSSSLRTIRNDAFRNASSLTAIDIPYSVTTLGTNVLLGAESLERVTYSPENNRTTVPGGFNFKYLFGVTGFAASPAIPVSLERIIVSEGTRHIPNDGLRELPAVLRIEAPVSLNSYGTNVLTGSTNLTTLRWTFISGLDNNAGAYLSYLYNQSINGITGLPVGLSEVTINAKPGVTRIIPSAFYNIGSIETLNLPSTITEIGNYALAHAAVGTSRLRYIDLPPNLVTLGVNVFENSSELLELDIPDSVTAIGTSLLTRTTKLQTLRFNHNSPISTGRFLRFLFGGTAFNSGGVIPTQLTTVELRGEPTALNAGYFFGFTSIETILLPASLTTLNNSVFQGMTALRQVQTRGLEVVPNQVILSDTITTFGTNMFQGATAITYVKMPATLTTIPNDTFNGATNLETVIGPTAYTTIGTSAFLNTKLGSITFPSTLTTIGASAFQGTLLTNVVIPNSVNNIGNDAFRSMPSLVSITFPNQMPVSPTTFTLGTNVLSGGQALTTINMHIDVLPSANRTLRYLFGGTTVGTGTLPSTLRTVNLTGGTILTTSFFSVISGSMGFITNVTLPSTLIEIQASAFSGMTGLLQLTIPATVVNIGASAFVNTSSITTLTFLNPALPTTLGLTLFTGMNSAALVFVPNGSLAVYQLNGQFAAFAERLIETAEESI